MPCKKSTTQIGDVMLSDAALHLCRKEQIIFFPKSNFDGKSTVSFLCWFSFFVSISESYFQEMSKEAGRGWLGLDMECTTVQRSFGFRRVLGPVVGGDGELK